MANSTRGMTAVHVVAGEHKPLTRCPCSRQGKRSRAVDSRQTQHVIARTARRVARPVRLADVNAVFDRPPALNAEDHPVLASVWDNEADAVFDEPKGLLEAGFHRERFVCPDCGPTGVDEDGCCTTCGADTIIEKVDI